MAGLAATPVGSSMTCRTATPKIRSIAPSTRNTDRMPACASRPATIGLIAMPTSDALVRKPNPNARAASGMALAAVVGSTPLPRTAVVSKLWDYIKKNNLQDKANKRNINADAKLKEIFGKAQVSMFEMTRLVNKHLRNT